MSKKMYKVLFIFIIPWIFIIHYELTKDDSLSTQSPTYDHIHISFKGHTENICRISFEHNSDIVEYEVKTVYFVNDETNQTLAGEWDPTSRTIALSQSKGLDVDTVSHEVAHVVETLFEIYNFEDSHYGPHIQGDFTACVWDIVQEDVRLSEKEEKFKFAN